MKHCIRRLVSPLLVFLLLHSSVTKALENVDLKSLEEVFAIATVMTDSDALTFGIANFELNYLVDENDNTIDVEKNIDIFVIPYQWKLDDINETTTHALNMRASYIELKRNSEPIEGYTNVKNEHIFGAFLEYTQHYQINEHWYSSASFGTHLMYYRNKYEYSEGFPEELSRALDGYIFNTTALMLMAEPVFEFGYQQKQSWGQWTAHNSSHYLFGQGVGGKATNIDDIQPEGWRVTNGIEFKFKVPQIWGISDHISFDFKRIDIGSDMSNLSNDGNYYETSVSWVIDTKNKIPLLDNIVVGINANYGSTISGCALVFSYNE